VQDKIVVLCKITYCHKKTIKHNRLHKELSSQS